MEVAQSSDGYFGALLIPMGIVMHIIGLKGTHGTPNLITMDALVIYRRD